MIGQEEPQMHIISSIRSVLFAVIVVTLVALAIPADSVAQIGIAIRIGPPALPVYEQPVCPGDGYLWTPGYWAYDYDINDYYWVPGTWVLAPEVGFLWTPGWWGWGGDAFIFHEGYWGPHIGFYGGINYGFGYFGVGFVGGRWDGGHFFYNRAVVNVNVVNVHNVYNETVIHETTVNRASFNGGNGGITARPTPDEERFANERHVGPVSAQTEHMQAARTDPQMRATVNHGRPSTAATPRAGAFNDRETVQAREAGTARPENSVPRPNDAKDLQPHVRPPAPNTGNAKQDEKFQKQQDKLAAQQEKDHQKLAAQQEKEHQQLAKQNASEAGRQQVEQRHQQQTQQMEQKHAQQQQHLQGKQSGGGQPK
jgi:hypothetical protein